MPRTPSNAPTSVASRVRTSSVTISPLRAPQTTDSCSATNVACVHGPSAAGSIASQRTAAWSLGVAACPLRSASTKRVGLPSRAARPAPVCTATSRPVDARRKMTPEAASTLTAVSTSCGAGVGATARRRWRSSHTARFRIPQGWGGGRRGVGVSKPSLDPSPFFPPTRRARSLSSQQNCTGALERQRPSERPTRPAPPLVTTTLSSSPLVSSVHIP